jgi:acyl CoA:acetate/3-ketoacid CoA transferase beta subunit
MPARSPATRDGAACDRAEACVIACAEAFRGDGEILASPIGLIPVIAVRLARHTFEPLLLVTDGEACVVEGTWPVAASAASVQAVGTPVPGPVESWLPYRAVLDVVRRGDRHVMMTPSQLDAFGNANISAIGSHAKPRAQLLGVRGAPGNTVSHPTSYWVPTHSPRVFVPKVDMVAGAGWDSAAKAGRAATRYMRLRRVVSNLASFDWDPGSRRMRLLSVHPGVTVDEVVAATGFDLVIGDDVPVTRAPTATELHLIREVIDPYDTRYREVPAWPPR